MEKFYLTAHPIVSGMHYAPHDGKEPKSYTLRVYDPENDTYEEVRTTSHLLSLARYCCIPTGINAHRAIFLMWNKDDTYHFYAEKEDGTLDYMQCQDWRFLNTGVFFKSRGKWCLFNESDFKENGFIGIWNTCEVLGFEQVGNFNVFINRLGEVYANEKVIDQDKADMAEPLCYSTIEVLDFKTMPLYDDCPNDEKGNTKVGDKCSFDVMRCTREGKDGERSTFYLSVIENTRKFSYVVERTMPFSDENDFYRFVKKFRENLRRFSD